MTFSIIAFLEFTLCATDVTSLYNRFNATKGNSQVLTANEIVKVLHNEGYIDTLYQFKNNEATRMASTVHFLMGKYFFASSMHAEAFAAAMKADSIGRYCKDKDFQSELKLLLGAVSFRQGNIDGSKACYNEALKLSCETENASTHRQAERGLWEVLRESNPVEALKHLEQYTAITDSLSRYGSSELENGFNVGNDNSEALKASEKYKRRLLHLSWICGALAILVIAIMALRLQKKYYRTKSHGNKPKAKVHIPITIDDKHARPENNEELAQIVDSIYARMGNGELDAAAISSDLGCTPRQLRDTVQRLTGESLAAFVMQVRLSLAARLLKYSDATVGEVARRCGFQTMAHFSRNFKQQYSITPTQYRRISDLEQSQV